MVETVFDTLNAKAALLGCRLAMDACGVELPIMVSATFPDTSGRLLGANREAFGRPSPMQDPHSRQQLRRRFKEVRPFLEDLAGLATATSVPI